MRGRVGARRSPFVPVAVVFTTLVLSLVAAWPASAASAGPVPSEWPQPNYSADGSRWNPYETVISPSNVSTVVQRWRARGFSPGTMNDGVVYGVVDVTNLEARSARTGALLWRTDVDPPFFFSTPASNATRVCAATGWFPGSVYCFDARTGAVAWSTTDAGGQGVFFYRGLLYVWGAGAITVFDPETGAEVWSVFQDDYPSTVAADGYLYSLDSFTDPGGIIEGTDITKYDVRTGQLIWHHSYSDLLAMVAKNGLLYVAGDRGEQLMALSTVDGSVVWQHHIDQALGDYIAPTLAVTSSTLYVHTDTGQFAALDAATGAPLWTKRLRPPEIDVAAPMSVAGGVLYVSDLSGDEYHLFALDAATGRVLYRQPHPSGIAFVAGGQVFAGDEQGAHVLGLPG